MDILGCKRGGRRFCLTLIVTAPAIAAQIVQAQSNRGAIQPAAGILAVGFGSPPEFPERFDRNVLGASGVPDDAGGHPRNSRIVRVKARVEVPRVGLGIHPVEEFGTSVHHTSNTGRSWIVTIIYGVLTQSRSSPSSRCCAPAARVSPEPLCLAAMHSRECSLSSPSVLK